MSIIIGCCLFGGCSYRGNFFDSKHLQEHSVADLPKPKNKIAKDKGSSVYISMTEQEFEQYVTSVYEYILSRNFKRLGTRGEILSGLIGMQYYVNTDVSQLSDFYNDTAEPGCTPFYGYIFVWANDTRQAKYGEVYKTVWVSHYLDLKYLSDKNQMYMEMCYIISPYHFAE